MRRFLVNSVFALPKVRGHGRILQLVRNYCYRPYERTLDNSIRMELDLYEWTQLTLASGQFTEPETVRLMRNLLSKGDTFLDVGAHVGTMGLVARHCIGAEGKVISIEPQPYNCQRILRNWELNGFENLKLYVAAAGPRNGSVSLPQQAATDKARLSLALHMPDALALQFIVPMITLETAMNEQQVDYLKLLKIDVEGFELQVLQGLGTMVDRVENIIFEILEPTANASDAATGNRALFEWLASHGFELWTVNREKWNGELPVLEANLWARRTTPLRAQGGK